MLRIIIIKGKTHEKHILALILTGILAALFSPAHPAHAYDAQWPRCGEITIVSPGEYSSTNLTIVYGMDGSDDIVDFRSYNGWKFYRFVIDYGNLNASNIANFADGATADTAYISFTTADITSISIELKKDCTKTRTCKPTEYYVYTLLGNYPCNLVSDEYPIPDRFLNTAYTGPLCPLPELAHQWNGKWIVNPIMECDGYQIGGKYYNSSLPQLP